MQIAILGKGIVGRTLAEALDDCGHRVTIGTRQAPSYLMSDQMPEAENNPFCLWLESRPKLHADTYANAVQQAELIIVALDGRAVIPVLNDIGQDLISNKIIIDLSNHLILDTNQPLPSFGSDNGSSLGEKIQQAFPNSHVVKALNHIDHSLMVNPGILGDNHHMFISGNDDNAKIQVREVLSSLGWKATQIIDLGSIVYARAMEMHLLLWVRLFQLLGTGQFNFELKLADDLK